MFCKRWAWSAQAKQSIFEPSCSIDMSFKVQQIDFYDFRVSKISKRVVGGIPDPFVLSCVTDNAWACSLSSDSHGSAFLRQTRVGAQPPNSHTFVRFAGVKQGLQENPTCCWTLRACSLVGRSHLMERSCGKGHGSALVNPGVLAVSPAAKRN